MSFARNLDYILIVRQVVIIKVMQDDSYYSDSGISKMRYSSSIFIVYRQLHILRYFDDMDKCGDFGRQKFGNFVEGENWVNMDVSNYGRDKTPKIRQFYKSQILIERNSCCMFRAKIGLEYNSEIDENNNE